MRSKRFRIKLIWCKVAHGCLETHSEWAARGCAEICSCNVSWLVIYVAKYFLRESFMCKMLSVRLQTCGCDQKSCPESGLQRFIHRHTRGRIENNVCLLSWLRGAVMCVLHMPTFCILQVIFSRSCRSRSLTVDAVVFDFALRPPPCRGLGCGTLPFAGPHWFA